MEIEERVPPGRRRETAKGGLRETRRNSATLWDCRHNHRVLFYYFCVSIIYVSTASKIVVLFFRGRTQLEIHPRTFRFAILFASHHLKHGSPLPVPLVRLSLLRTWSKVLWNRMFAVCCKIVEEIFISVFRIFYFDAVRPVTLIRLTQFSRLPGRRNRVRKERNSDDSPASSDSSLSSREASNGVGLTAWTATTREGKPRDSFLVCCDFKIQISSDHRWLKSLDDRTKGETRTTVLIFRVTQKHENHRRVRRVR